MPKLLLFDIDGTLIDSGGAGLLALNWALEELTGVADGMRDVNPAGKTDIQILREALANAGLEMEQRLFSGFMVSYPMHLEKALKVTNGGVKPGVRELLERLQIQEDHYLGLLTGNVEIGARLKLQRYSLHSFFSVGAYGSDEEDRNKLPVVAIRKAQKAYGVSVGLSDCVVIGDTPRDVECAKVHGLPCLVVATGRYPLEVLQLTEADLILPDLSDTDRIVQWVARL